MTNSYEIFYAILSKTASDEEKVQFGKLISKDENKRLFNQIKKVWDKSGKVKDYKTFEKSFAFHEVTQKIKQNKILKRRYFSIAVTSVAASILLMFGLFSITGLPKFIGPGLAAVTFQTDIGNRSVVVLPDSSRVWLNSQSKISYNADFGKQNRNVSLTGEGFFEVSHSRVPFIVNVNNFKIKVHGTRFNVSAYPQDKDVLTSLESGKISIDKNGKSEFYLKPGQLAVYNKSASSFNIKSANVAEYSAWKENKMYMHAESLDKLGTKLERKYNVKIAFKPESLGSTVHYSGVFDDENIEEVLDAISIASELKYTKSGNHYYVSYK